MIMFFRADEKVYSLWYSIFRSVTKYTWHHASRPTCEAAHFLISTFYVTCKVGSPKICILTKILTGEDLVTLPIYGHQGFRTFFFQRRICTLISFLICCFLPSKIKSFSIFCWDSFLDIGWKILVKNDKYTSHDNVI